MIKLCFPIQFPFPKHPIPGTLGCAQITYIPWTCETYFWILGPLHTLFPLSRMFSACHTPKHHSPFFPFVNSHSVPQDLVGASSTKASLFSFLALLVGTISNNVKNSKVIIVAAVTICFYVPDTMSCLYNMLSLLTLRASLYSHYFIDQKLRLKVIKRYSQNQNSCPSGSNQHQAQWLGHTLGGNMFWMNTNNQKAAWKLWQRAAQTTQGRGAYLIV